MTEETIVKRIPLTFASITGTVTMAAALALAACSAPGVASPTAQPTRAAAAPTTAPLPTISASTEQTDLDLGISGSGEVKAAQDADLVFVVQGTVADVSVKEGDLVKKGDLLAILDTRALDQQLQQAEAQLASAQAQEAALSEEPRDFEVTAAAAQLRQAQAALTVVQAGAKPIDLEQAQAAVDAAQVNLQATRDRVSAAKTQAELQMQQATQTLTQAQARYAQAKYNWEYANDTGNDPVVPEVSGASGKSPNKLSDGQLENYYAQFVQAEAALRQAEKSVDLAKIAYDTARQAEVTGVQAAEQQLRQAQIGLEKVKQPADKDRVAAAQAAVAQARAAQQRLEPNPRDSQKAQASAGIAQAQSALELARINRERAELRAPFDGVVAAVNVDPGDPSSSGNQPAIQVVDVSSLHVDVQISDVDIGKIKTGQAAEVRVDAIPETVFKGRIGYIAPTATSVGAIRTFLVRIELDDIQGLRAGMSAQVTIVTQ
jgi:HlyD family secretion protein